jgi:hypothetical protein
VTATAAATAGVLAGITAATDTAGVAGLAKREGTSTARAWARSGTLATLGSIGAIGAVKAEAGYSANTAAARGAVAAGAATSPGDHQCVYVADTWQRKGSARCSAQRRGSTATSTTAGLATTIAAAVEATGSDSAGATEIEEVLLAGDDIERRSNCAPGTARRGETADLGVTTLSSAESDLHPGYARAGDSERNLGRRGTIGVEVLWRCGKHPGGFTPHAACQD